jgi:hypothetical protein
LICVCSRYFSLDAQARPEADSVAPAAGLTVRSPARAKISTRSTPWVSRLAVRSAVNLQSEPQAAAVPGDASRNAMTSMDPRRMVMGGDPRND